MKKKHVLIIGILLVIVFVSVPVYHILNTKWNENKKAINTPEGYTNDASQLNLTRVNTIIQVSNNKTETLNLLRNTIQYAKENKLKISLAGAKHTMGGHTMYPGGIVINMLPYNNMELDTLNNILTIGSGALWEDALKYLDKYGKSVSIMQAFSSFTVGGSISANGHGWQKDLPPVSASVVSFTLMNEQGDVVTCSRNENAELFKLVIGGYGLFGIILDVKLKVTDNVSFRFKYIRVSPENYVAYYKKYVSENPDVELVFGRLRISDKKFLEEATISFFEKTMYSAPPLQNEKNTETQRLVFRGSVDSEYGKRLRWNLENQMNKLSKNEIFSRNELLNDHVSLIENKDTASTDLLQEYFIPENNFNNYIEDIKPVLKNSKIDLLNITIRGVYKDNDSYMNYARENVFGFVYLFNQKKNSEDEEEMKNLTNVLVDIAHKNNGTFYLPYRLHIDKEKMRKSYPLADTFFLLKQKYDPLELFNNKFYEHYK